MVSDKPTKPEAVPKKKKARITAEKYESEHGNFVAKGSVSKESTEQQEEEIEFSDEDVKATAAVNQDDEIVIGVAKELFANRPMPVTKEGHSKEIFKINNLGLLHCYSIVLL